MDFQTLKARALEIRAKYAQFEQEQYGKEWTAGQLMQGFVGDIGDLNKLVMAKEGVRNIENVDEKLAHELSDCLWSLLVLADKFDVDLEGSFMQTMDELEERFK